MMILFRLARSKVFSPFVSWFFAHLSFLLPLKRVFESERLVAFHHPRPSYPLHILLVPKRAISSVSALGPADHNLLLEIVRTAQTLAENMGPGYSNYRLVLNAGAYQEIPHLHFHLISDEREE